jgi:hypothetical protein
MEPQYYKMTTQTKETVQKMSRPFLLEPDNPTKQPHRKLRVSIYDEVSKIFRTGAAIYTAVVVARSTGPNMPNCEVRVLLRLLQRLRENV